MLRKTIALICLGVLTGGGCAKKADKESTRGGSGVSQMAISPVVMGAALGSVASRFLAVRQKLVVVAPGAGLAKSLEAVIAFCGTLQCEVISSNITGQTTEAGRWASTSHLATRGGRA